MCVFCEKSLRCRTCGEIIEETPLSFSEAIEDETIVPGILAQKLVCNECKLEQIQVADTSKLGFYKTFGMRSTGINN